MTVWHHRYTSSQRIRIAFLLVLLVVTTTVHRIYVDAVEENIGGDGQDAIQPNQQKLQQQEPDDENVQQQPNNPPSSVVNNNGNDKSDNPPSSITSRPRPPRSFKLNDGNYLPMVGLGVAESSKATYQAVKWAISGTGGDEGEEESADSCSYRLIDTASHESYGNEDQVGQAIRDVILSSKNRRSSRSSQSSNNDHKSIKREDIFVTTKLWDEDHGFEDAVEGFEESLENLGLKYIDLYMIHSPFGGYLVETWDALVFLQQQKQTKEPLVKSIGVSNFDIKHLETIRQGGTRPLPAVNQIEIHPLLYQQRKPLLDYCKQHNIQVQAFGSLLYGSLTDWEKKEPLKTVMLNHPTKTSAQILLRWAIQHDIAVIPKSTNRHRIHENIQIFDFVLDENDMALLDNWGNTVSPEDRLMYQEWDWNPVDEAPVHEGETDWFPDFEGFEDHFEEDYFDDDDDDLQAEL